MLNEQQTAQFYDRFWPANVPNYHKTKQYINKLLPRNRYFKIGLDAGCGSGVASIALADKCKKIYSVDISQKSVNVAKKIARKYQKTNINFQVASIIKLPFANQCFDLVFSWGVVHHTQDPYLAIAELCRVLKKEGILVIAVYQKTWLTPFYELIRITCINLPNWTQSLILDFLTAITRSFLVIFAGQVPKRDDVTIKAQVQDWFFVPQKHFFSKTELKRLLKKYGISFKITEEFNGRFRSTGNIVIIGQKPAER